MMRSSEGAIANLSSAGEMITETATTLEIHIKTRVCKPLILYAGRYIDVTIEMTLNISK
jgi:hypothetical protein